MPSHVIMGGGMTTAQATKIMTTLPTHWKAEEGKDLTSKIGKTTTEILGKTFVESLGKTIIKFFFLFFLFVLFSLSMKLNKINF